MSRYANKLDPGNSARLTVLLMEEFNKSGMTDRDFAQYASAKLGCKVMVHHINARRKTLGIAANHNAAALAQPQVSLEDFEALQARVQTLEAQVANWYLRATGTLPPQE